MPSRDTNIEPVAADAAPGVDDDVFRVSRHHTMLINRHHISIISHYCATPSILFVRAQPRFHATAVTCSR